MEIQLQKGDKVKFKRDRFRYTVQALNDRYVICTRKFFKTVMYTIIDFKRNERGTDNLVFSFGYEDQNDCDENLVRLTDGTMEVSFRNCVELDIERVDKIKN